jgi:phosphatidylglycerol:prolipoprotein diacylglycerol transferase
MIPILFKIGPFNVYSYGLMLGIAFLLGGYVVSIELKRKKINPDLAAGITTLAVLFGIVGAKLLFLIENWSEFVQRPLAMAFSGGGLTWYGGLVVAIIAVYLYLKAKKAPLLKVWDAIGLGLMIAYGVGRIGCHLSGDGDYGFPTNLPWGTNYEKGLYPPSRAFESFPEITSQYPGGVVPDSTPLHPTPVYELLLSIVGFLILWRLRKRGFPDGTLFMFYLMLASVFRFGIEFLRLNPRVLVGLSEAQFISSIVFFIGLFGVIYLQRKKESTT